VDLDPALALRLKNYIRGRQTGPLFGTSSGLPLSARNIMRDSLHPILKAMGRGSAGFHIFRRFRESHANGEMAGRYGKRLLDNVRWRQECAAKVGLGFMLPQDRSKPLLDKSGQVFEVEIAEAVAQ
jgi:hypothetical protein